MSEADKPHDLRLAAQVSQGGGKLRPLLLELWQRTRIDWGFVTDRLAQTFRRERWVGSHERRFVAETLFGMVRHFRRLDHALDARSPRDADRLLAYLVTAGQLPVEAARRAVPQVDWGSVAERWHSPSRERDPVRRLALLHSMPDWLAAQLVADWGAQAEPLALALNQRAPMTVRTNRLRASPTDLAATLAGLGLETRPGQYAANALRIESRTNLFALPPFTAGQFEAQDEGSQLLAEITLAALPASGQSPILIDLCAGAGGKTLALADALGNRGRVIASDIDDRKLDEQRKRARRAGVTCVQTISLAEDPMPPPLAKLRGRADVVLVDAPCSGIGALRRNPEAKWRLTPADLLALNVTQREVLTTAGQLVRPGGRVVYATCTVTAQENRAIVDDTLARQPALRPVRLDALWPAERAAQFGDGLTFQSTPHQHDCDGFFAAVLERVPS